MDSHDKQGIEWHTTVLPAATQKALAFVSREAWLKRSTWYLAGGTALALQVGHRASFDLDFFTPEEDFTPGSVIGHFSGENWITDILREGTIYGRLLEAKVSFIAYPFFVPKARFQSFGSVRVLDAKDIAVMKIIAISQRGRKRDFIDLFWYCQNREQLFEVMLRLPDQYPTVAHDYHHICKSLTYFEDAEEDPMPDLHFSVTWKEIKRYFQKEVPRIVSRYLDLS